jgi:4-hydroxy-2-oxoheptanedioate aldolase
VADIPRLNGVIKAFENGQKAFLAFCPPDITTAQAMGSAKYDGLIFEMEHNPYDIRTLRDCFQYLLNRRQIVESGTLAPAVTPLVRIPPNGSERNQWIAKQVLDSGAYGIIWPHVSTVEEAFTAVAACRYPRPETADHYSPPGVRGDAPTAAARYWGISAQDYYQRADVWPLATDGEILVVIQCEEKKAIAQLPDMLREVPGIGAVLIGEGDLSQDLGYPRQYDHPTVASAIADILAICQDAGVPCGHPHVNEKNVERVLEQGFQWLMPAPVRSFSALERGRELAGREGTGPR